MFSFEGLEFFIGFEGAELCVCDSVCCMDMCFGMGSIPWLWKDCCCELLKVVRMLFCHEPMFI